MSVPKGPGRNSAHPMSIRDLARKLTREEQSARGNHTDNNDDDFHDEVHAPPRKQGRATSLREGASRMMAGDLGVDPDLAAKAGPSAAKVLGALTDANTAEDSAEKTRCINRAQKHLQTIDPARHGALVQQLQARLLAAQGRGGDTEVAHVTPGELVIPPNLQAPEILSLLQKAATSRGIDVTRLFVGSADNSMNPRTGTPEFAGRGDFRSGSMFGPAELPGYGMGGWPGMDGSIVSGWANDLGFSGNGFGHGGRGQQPFDSAPVSPGSLEPHVNYRPSPPPEGIEQINALPPIWTPGAGVPGLLNRNIAIDGTNAGHGSGGGKLRIGSREYPIQEGDLDLLTRMIFSEGASNWDVDGVFEKMGWTAINRIGAQGFKRSLKEVLEQKDKYDRPQFQAVSDDPNSLWMKSANPSALTGSNISAYERANEIAKGILQGQIPDSSGGATFFYTGSEPQSFTGMIKNNRIESIDFGDQSTGDFTFLRVPRKGP